MDSGTPSSSPASLEARRVRVHGRVQGVGYRHACVLQARALGVAGWVRNRADGTVEALLQGTPSQLTRLCSWLRDEVPNARVDKMDITALTPPWDHLDGFEQRATA